MARKAYGWWGLITVLTYSFVCLVIILGAMIKADRDARDHLRPAFALENQMSVAISQKNASQYHAAARGLLSLGQSVPGIWEFTYHSSVHGPLVVHRVPGTRGLELRRTLPTDLGTWSLTLILLPEAFWLGLIRLGLALVVLSFGLEALVFLSRGPRAKAGAEVPTAEPLSENSQETVVSTPPAPMPVSSPSGESRSPAAFLHRLNHELQRAGENALDLSILVVRFHQIDEERDIWPVLVQEFVHDDLIFPLGRHHYGVILPHLDIDQAMARGEYFLRRCQGLWPQEGPGTLALGLSSRSGRILEGRGLYHEAMAALKRTRKEKVAMVGFKADPSKYRTFLLRQVV